MSRSMAGLVILVLVLSSPNAADAQTPAGGETTGRAHAHAPPHGAPVANLPAGAWAITICRTRPVTWFSEEMPEHARGMVEAHEAEHRRHMASFPSCEEFWAWRRADPEHEIIAEARAFCAGAKYEMAGGKHRSFLAAVREQALVFENYHVWRLEDAVAAIIRNCDPFRPYEERGTSVPGGTEGAADQRGSASSA
jgi:hypothetical protein